jgi:hypothetical protein
LPERGEGFSPTSDATVSRIVTHALDGVRDPVDGVSGCDRAWVDEIDRVRSVERFG